jgi:peroxiredoxin
MRFPKGRSARWLRDLAIAGLLVLGIRAYQQRGLPSGPAPELVATDLAGAEVSLEQYRGQPLVLLFFATWCGVCRAAQSNFDSVAADMPVLAVASQSGSSEQVASYVRAQGIAPRVVNDASGELAKRYGVRAFPTTFVLDVSGAIRHTEVGYTTELGLRLRAWLAKL